MIIVRDQNGMRNLIIRRQDYRISVADNLELSASHEILCKWEGTDEPLFVGKVLLSRPLILCRRSIEIWVQE